MWEFPGGKRSEGESNEQALARELEEELAVRLHRFGRLLFEARDPETPFIIRFFEVELEGAPTALEHADIGWFTPELLHGMELAPADGRFVRDVLLAEEGDRSLSSPGGKRL